MWWYVLMKNYKFFGLFCNMIGLDAEIMDDYLSNHYNPKTIKFQSLNNKSLPLNRKVETELIDLIDNLDIQLDFIVLYYVAFLHLSSQFTGHINKGKNQVEKITQNCYNLVNNAIVKVNWTFAFLEILIKIFDRLNLDFNSVKVMQIDTITKFEDIDMLLNAVESEVMERDEIADTSWSGDQATATKTKKKEQKKMTIEYFGTDLTKECKDGFIDPVIWRENEINQIIYTLLRKTKNNPLLIWEAWVGKTAVVEWLARKIVDGQVPDKLKNKRLFLLDMWTLVAGTKYRWEFESRMKSILEEATDPLNNIILFIDEIHTMIGAGGQEQNDAAQMIKPLLSRWKIKLIWATTYHENQKYIEKDAALKRRFQEVIINEPDTETTKKILVWLKTIYEDFHWVSVTDESLDAAIKLSKRYMLNKHLPDKALDIIDEACARKSTINPKLENDEEFKRDETEIIKLQEQIEKHIDKQDYFMAAQVKEQIEEIKRNMQKIRKNKSLPEHLRPTVSPQDVWNVLADKTGIPANVVNESEIERLRKLDSDLKSHIFGQDEAVDAIVKTLTRSRLSVIEKNKPIWSFMFLGPSGVWKTYLAKLIAKNYFWDEKAMVRIDMSEFMEKYSVSKLIWAPAGYIGYDEGGGLTESIRRKPYCVVLFDEIEKASSDVLNILLQILDEGHLKDAKWRIVDFKSTIIIMTSNLGSEEFSKKRNSIWFITENKQDQKDKEFDTIKARVLDDLKNFLTPEFLNRIDYKIVFKPLTKKVMWTIFKNKIEEFLGTWRKNSEVKEDLLPVFWEQKIKDIIEKIYEPQFGARPIERYIFDEIEPSIITSLLEKK